MIGYPNKKRTMVQNNVRDNYMGRGMSLEDDLNKSNAYYMEMKRALIHKKPIPIQIVKVDYPQRSSAKIVEAYYKTPSTTDYNGIYRGKAIDFEAKETKNQKHRFLSKISTRIKSNIWNKCYITAVLDLLSFAFPIMMKRI